MMDLREPQGRSMLIRCAILLATLASVAVVRADEAPATTFPNDLYSAITGGKVDVFMRYRFEYVNDDILGIKNAYANTLRTAIGYNTGLFRDFGFYVQMEDVRSLGQQLYNDGGSNGVKNRATVVDPAGTELKQLNLRYEGLPGTVVRVGRQDIQHRQAPMHRYVGNILWRQVWQTFDALRITNKTLPATTIDYAYVWNVNRIFGEVNPTPEKANFRSDSHFFNAVYTGFPLGKFEPYAYLLDIESPNSSRFSSKTFGLRFDGNYWLDSKAKLNYTAEFANQSDYGNNPTPTDVNYYLGEFGGSYAVGGILESIGLIGSYEVLQGDGGTKSFQTPLGTNHAFQGWADRFLITPGDGVKDLFVTLKATVMGANFMAVYHDFSSDKDNYDYGHEWDFVVEKPFAKYFLAGLKYANYEADDNNTNLARNSASTTGLQAHDLEKFWAYVQFKF
jgi:hypothetical protein